MRILALDLATRTGWAYGEEGRLLESGVQDFGLARGESPGMRFIRFRVWLVQILGVSKPTVVVYERPHLRGGATATVAIGLETRVQELAIGCELCPVHSMSLKKAIFGSGKAGKPDAIAWAAKKLGRQPIDDNEADAVALLEYGWRTLLEASAPF